MWKSKKILKINFGIFSKTEETNETRKLSKAEELTIEIDREGMRYLSYLLYPLCLAGAIYSLIYQPHKRYIYHPNIHFIFIIIIKTFMLTFPVGIRGH